MASLDQLQVVTILTVLLLICFVTIDYIQYLKKGFHLTMHSSSIQQHAVYLRRAVFFT